EVQRAVARYIGATDLAPDDVTALRDAATDAGSAAGLAALTTLVGGHTARIEQRAAEAEEASATLTVRVAAALSELDRGRSRAAALRRRVGLRTEQTELHARVGEHREDRSRLATAHRARAVQPLIDGLERAEQGIREAAAAVARARADAPADLHVQVEEVADPALQRKILGVERDRCTAVLATLDRLVGLEATLPGRREALARDQAARDEERAEHTRLTAELAGC